MNRFTLYFIKHVFPNDAETDDTLNTHMLTLILHPIDVLDQNQSKWANKCLCQSEGNEW